MVIWLFFLLSHASFAEDAQAPKTLIHVGNYSTLQKNKDGNVPQADWDRFIMGSEGRYGLVPYRRGLYGGTDFDNLEIYSTQYLGTEKVPWAMRIVIKDECLVPERVSDLNTDEKYVNWLLVHGPEIFADESKCLNLEASSCKDLIIGNEIANGAEENKCDKWLNTFLQTHKIAIARDKSWPNSWYIRDRNCIEKIEVDANSMLKTLAEAKWDWHSRKSSYSGSGGYGTASFAKLVRALAELENADDNLLEQIRKKTETSDIAGFYTESNAENPQWIKKSGPILIDAYRRCQKKELKEFRKIAGELAESLHEKAASNHKANRRMEVFDSRFQEACR
jgi:hypothetical protein